MPNPILFLRTSPKKAVYDVDCEKKCGKCVLFFAYTLEKNVTFFHESYKVFYFSPKINTKPTKSMTVPNTYLILLLHVSYFGFSIIFST